jgi:hypothetical protein
MHSFFLTSFCFLFIAANASAEIATKLQMKGSGWYQFGQIVHSSDTLNPLFNYNKNWITNYGAQFTVLADVEDHFQGAIGLGGLQQHTPQGDNANAYQTTLVFTPYITQARFSYYSDTRESSPFILHFGLFPYQYNRDVRNFGAYLFRGPVYPGVLISEFESKSLDTTVGNIVGVQLQNNIGKVFTQDLILRSETEFPPVFDLSLAYVATLKLGGVLELGAGVNFYRLIPSNKNATNLTDRDAFPIKILDPGSHPYEDTYGHITVRDTTIIPLDQRASPNDSLQINGDTLVLSHQGIKLMGRISFDPKPWFGSGIFGADDLKLYAEAAVIGTKSYAGIYPDIMQRIPIMFGFNFPTFGLLDQATIEAEYYGAPFRDDYRRLISEASPIPMNNHSYDPNRVPDDSGYIQGTKIRLQDPYDLTSMHRDDWKWSIYLSKTFANCTKASLQAANDHFRPNVSAPEPRGTERLESAFTTLQDWYVMFKLGFFF